MYSYILRSSTISLFFSTVPADQQAEYKELSQDIQELEQKLNQEYRQKTVGIFLMKVGLRCKATLALHSGHSLLKRNRVVGVKNESLGPMWALGA